MKKGIALLMVLGVILLFAGTAGAQQVQVLLPGKSIPKYVEPLPLTEFEFIDATGVPGLNGTPFPVNAYEFKSQILPAANNPLLPNWPPKKTACVDALGAPDTSSYTWGYRSAGQPAVIQTTYLGPVVISETGVAVNPVYGNKLPLNGAVQANLPIDQTLDWADPLGTTGPVGCLPDPLGNFTNPFCGVIPYSGPIPIATHLHGGEVAPAYDGGPDAWFTQDLDGVGGPDDVGAGYPGYDVGLGGTLYNYPNNQQEGTIWFHDHALGITRLNVYAGLAGLMPIIDPAHPPVTPLPQLADGYDIPLIIQDRSFDTNCEIFYNLASNPMPNPTVHPFWIPEFIGDTIVVNGKTWPYLNVEPRQYRFRLVNGSNARFYDLTLAQSKTLKSGNINISKTTMPVFAIATDDGYLMNAVSTPNIVIGPGERYEIIIDFGGLAGTEWIMMNSARTPFPGGGKVVQNLTDQVMQFRVNQPLSGVVDTAVIAGSPLRDPATNPIHDIKVGLTPMPPPPATVPVPPAPLATIVRQLTLNEVIGAGGPLELVVNNSKLNLADILPSCNTTACRETEMPAVGDTEIWEIINITADAHPMHTHLTSFQVINRQLFNAAQWIAAYDAALLTAYPGVDPGGKGPPYAYHVRNADGAIGGNPPINASLIGAPILPLPSEQGWKDTVITYPGEVTRIAVRWAPTDMPATGAGAPVVGTNYYDDFPNFGFDPTVLVEDPNNPDALNVGYVWHCHIVDHEDNEMMRNYTVGTAQQFIQ